MLYSVTQGCVPRDDLGSAVGEAPPACEEQVIKLATPTLEWVGCPAPYDCPFAMQHGRDTRERAQPFASFCAVQPLRWW
jgi:hypothetical protein